MALMRETEAGAEEDKAFCQQNNQHSKSSGQSLSMSAALFKC